MRFIEKYVLSCKHILVFFSVFVTTYNSLFTRYDFAIITLKNPFSLETWRVKPICLPYKKSHSNILNKNSITITGWGQTDIKGTLKDRLQYANVEIVPRLKCYRDHLGSILLQGMLKIIWPKSPFRSMTT